MAKKSSGILIFLRKEEKVLLKSSPIPESRPEKITIFKIKRIELIFKLKRLINRKRNEAKIPE